MRTIKPVCSSVISRCIEHQRKHYLGISVMTHIPMEGLVHLSSEQTLWPMLGKFAPTFIEQSIPRIRSEYLLYGTVYPPDQDSAAAYTDFGIRIGDLQKKGRTFGQRLMQGSTMQKRNPVVPVSLLPDYAYGGVEYADNPTGTGHPSSLDDQYLELPMVELLSNPWHPEVGINQPAIFGQLDIMHPSRQKLAGTYGDDWLKVDYPGMPKDADWAIFNTAMPEQQMPEPFRGDEQFDLVNLSAHTHHISGQLPGIGARVFVQFKDDETRLHDLSTALRSLVFLPEANAIVMIWQTQCEIATDDARDVALLMSSFEHLSRPRAVSHYQETLLKWSDKTDGSFASLDESSLVPEDVSHAGLLDGMPDLNAPVAPESLGARLKKKTEKGMQQARAEVVSHGLDPDTHAPPEHLPPVPKIPPAHELGPFMRKLRADAEKTEQDAQAFRIDRETEVKETYRELGMDFSEVSDEVAGKGKGAAHGPPKSCKDEALHTLREADERTRSMGGPVAEIQEMLADEALHQQWADADEQALQAYRMGAHHQSPCPRSDGDKALRQRQSLEDLLRQGESIEGLDLTGANLAGIDLSGVNCQEILLESANLRDANLSGASFRGAVLAHADLSGANLQDCDFTKANLGKTVLQGADARRALLINATLDGVIFAKVNLQEAVFRDSQWVELDFSHSDLRGAHLQKASFLKCNLNQSLFQGALLDGANFVDCSFEASSWEGCSGEKVAFVNLENPDMNFSNANLPGSVWAGKVDLSASNFSGANLDKAYFSQGTNLQGINFSGLHALQADFTACQLQHANFSGANLRMATFRNARLDGVDFSRADLMEALMQNAHLEGASLTSTHLYAADLARIHTDKRTGSENADYTKARVYPRLHPPELNP